MPTLLCKQITRTAVPFVYTPPAQAVLIPGNVIPETAPIRGYDFNQGVDFDAVMAAMLTTGFQASALGQAVEEINRMVSLACLGCLCNLLDGSHAQSLTF